MTPYPRVWHGLMASCIAVSSGCAVIPADLDVGQATFVAGATPPTFKVNVTTSAGKGTRVGALGGLGGGALLASAACAATGFLFPVCVAGVITSAGGLGAAAGAAAGAQMKESVEERQRKADFLTHELTDLPYATALVDRVRQGTLAKGAAAPTIPASTVPGSRDEYLAGPSPWLVEISVVKVSTEGKARFQLQLEAKLQIRRPGSNEIVFQRTYSEDSESEQSLEEWTAEGASHAHAEVGAMLGSISLSMIDDLSRNAVVKPNAVALRQPL